MKKTTWIAIMLFSIFGLVGWIFISVVGGISKGISGHTPLESLIIIFGLITFFYSADWNYY